MFFTDVRPIGKTRQGNLLVAFTLVAESAISLENAAEDKQRTAGDQLRADRDMRFGIVGNVIRGVCYTVYQIDRIHLKTGVGVHLDTFDVNFSDPNKPVLRSHDGAVQISYVPLSPSMIVNDIPAPTPFFANDIPFAVAPPPPVVPPVIEVPPPIILPPPPVILPPVSSLRAELEQIAVRLAELAKKA